MNTKHNRSIDVARSVLFSCLLLSSPVWGTSGTLTIKTNTTLTETHEGNIVIAADFITLNCDDHTVTGNGTGTGIELNGTIGVTVEDCIVTNFADGFSLVGSLRNIFTGNQVNNNKDEGFDIEQSNGNLFTLNTVTTNASDGFDLDDSHGNIFQENEVTHNRSNGIELDRCNNNIFEVNTVNNNGTSRTRSGFSLDTSSGNFFRNNTADNNSRNGFRLEIGSNDNTLLRNRACGNVEGDVFQDGTSSRNLSRDNEFCQGQIPFGPPPD